MSTIEADKILSLLENTTPLSRHGKAWLTACIDPMHDEQIPDLVGFPDGSNTRSVVQIVRSTMTISKSAKVTTPTWDAHIISFPWVNTTEYFKGSTFSRPQGGGPGVAEPGDLPVFGAIKTANVPAPPYGYWGGISCYQNDVNTNTNNPFNGTQVISDQDLTSILAPDSNYLTGNYRVIAKGYEILSVGPPISQSGTLYAWQQPSANSPDTSTATIYWLNAAGVSNNTTSTSVITYDYPPNSIQEANLIPNTKSWPQKMGAYMVDRMNGPSNFSYNNSDAVMACKGITPAGNGLVNIPAIFNAGYTSAAQFAGTSASTIITQMYTSNISPFGFSGVYITGLNAADVLTINAIWYIERIPTNDQKDLLVLTQPTPLRDDTALNTYSTIASKMPPGMYQKSNSFGDWFKDAVSVVADTVGPALSMMPGPLGAVGKAASVGGKMLDNLLQKTNDSPSPTSTVDLNLKELKKEEPRPPLRRASGGKKEAKKEVKEVKKVAKAMKKMTLVPGMKKKKKGRSR